MALYKNITSREGITTTYHKISEVLLEDGALHCTMDSYVSKEYRELKRPAMQEEEIFGFTVEEEESMGIRQLAYKKFKELEKWADAIDC